MEIFLKYKIIILRTLGLFLLLGGFLVRFWVMPVDGLSKNELAAANLARMQASVSSVSSSKKAKNDSSHYIKSLKETQKKQLEYLTIILMIIGVSSLAYSFMPKREES